MSYLSRTLSEYNLQVLQYNSTESCVVDNSINEITKYSFHFYSVFHDRLCIPKNITSGYRAETIISAIKLCCTQAPSEDTMSVT